MGINCLQKEENNCSEDLGRGEADLLWAPARQNLVGIYHIRGQKYHVVIPIQALRRNLKKLTSLSKGYLVAVKSYNPLKDVKENAKTLHQRSNPVRGKDQRQSICVKPIFIADLSV